MHTDKIHIDWENTSVLDYDDDYFKRKVKETVVLR